MKERTIKFTMDDHSYELKLYPDHIQEEIPEIDVLDEQLINVVDANTDLLLPMNVRHAKDMYQLNYQLNDGLRFYRQLITTLDELDSIRLGINLLQLLQLQDTSFVPVVNPNNLVFDINLVPHVVHRGIQGVLKPEQTSDTALFDQIKALIISTVFPQYKFEKLYNGVLKSNLIHNKNIRKIADSDEPDLIQDELLQLYNVKKTKSESSQKTISKKKWGIYQKGFWVTGLTTIILAVVAGYFLLIKAPLDNKLNASTTAYMNTNYDKVIEDLEKVPTARLPLTNKLLLAKSYVNVENLNHLQKNNILNSLNTHSDTHYMDYWIYNGRGDFNKSLDTAKFIGDNQLIMYSYTKLYSAANNNPKLTGSKKQRLLQSYSKQINLYSHKLQKDHKK
ncbi:type VII secretion protein EssB [Bombilactobacillus thymidiniphilus]|uniref:Type VII secretion protein EssB n=1 Tax=Bombilactobacillus thymidiniphilus TaxID=2923363 RepID=A0ABY4PEY5_9LACO|nr:type VII secretion protein EssB [Bombilactobacillus thymidiniphilus]UQS84081.1 type VII secretion protein EssB [Bombilactobacillus thymidiniphilus]